MTTTDALGLADCRFCGKRPGTKVGPPALVRCITEGCEGRELAASTTDAWNAGARLRSSPSAVREAPAVSTGDDDIWPNWAESILKKLQEYGFDAVDDDQTVDLAAAFDEWVDGYAAECDRKAEQLEAELAAVSTGEVVAWQKRWKNDPNSEWLHVWPNHVEAVKTQGWEVRPLYASLPAAKAAGDDRTCAENAQVASGDVRAAVIEECVNIALAIDSGRGNEKEIAKAIRALSQAPATDAAAVARGEEERAAKQDEDGYDSLDPGVTCYERDEQLCRDPMCLRLGCRISNAKGAIRPTLAPNGAGREALEAVYAELHTTAEYYASTMTGLPTGSAVSEWIENDLIPNIEETVAALASSPVVGRTEWQPIDQEPDEWQWRACIGGRWGSWLHLDQPIGYFKGRNAFNLDNGTYELRPLYALPTPPSETKDAAVTRPHL